MLELWIVTANIADSCTTIKRLKSHHIYKEDVNIKGSRVLQHYKLKSKLVGGFIPAKQLLS